jgi:hypothetical protein
MTKIINFDFTKKKRIEEKQETPLSDIPEFNQPPTLELCGNFDGAVDFSKIIEILQMYMEHPYLDVRWKVRDAMIELLRVLITSKLKLVGMSQQLADKINKDSESKHS